MISFPTGEEFATLCINNFKSLPKTGKPSESEWTVLSCIILHDSTNNHSKVISLGTGTKCIGQHEMSPSGLILNDSHAEVVARRALLRYIYSQLIKDGQIFVYNNDTVRYKLRAGITFHFFSSHPPCGDASILSPIEDENDDGPTGAKIRKLTTNTVFTGARLIKSDICDPMDQQLGQLRTKPGRGVRTLSMSCSDKISRWNFLGFQGALLDSLLEEPLYIKTYNFCGKLDQNAVVRAIYGRWEGKSFVHHRYHSQRPEVRSCPGIQFEHSQSDTKDPSPSSIIWCDVSNKPLEVAICGRKQGVTKKKLETKSAALQISKVVLLEQYAELLKMRPDIQKRLELGNVRLKTYKEAKSASKDYQEAWWDLKTSIFENWTQKPGFLLDFKLKH